MSKIRGDAPSRTSPWTRLSGLSWRSTGLLWMGLTAYSGASKAEGAFHVGIASPVFWLVLVPANFAGLLLIVYALSGRDDSRTARHKNETPS